MTAILFLDDDQDRRAAFKLREPDAHTMSSVPNCLYLLLQYGFVDEVHLDHDLTGETYCDSDREDTGMEVVRWLCCNPGSAGTVVVHTHNEIAAPKMVKALEAAGYRVVRAPFTAGRR